jgi:hypothetical protein
MVIVTGAYLHSSIASKPTHLTPVRVLVEEPHPRAIAHPSRLDVQVAVDIFLQDKIE